VVVGGVAGALLALRPPAEKRTPETTLEAAAAETSHES
jgi:hypothetical protein